jgi:isoleucyl-tRNA synthetase
MIPILDEIQRAEIEAVSDLIKAEVNVKEIELLDDASGVLVKQIKPNFKTLLPRFGKDMGLISKEIQNFSQEQINEIEAKGLITLVISRKKHNFNIRRCRNKFTRHSRMVSSQWSNAVH